MIAYLKQNIAAYIYQLKLKLLVRAYNTIFCASKQANNWQFALCVCSPFFAKYGREQQSY